MLKLKRFKEGVWYPVPDLPNVKMKIRPVPLAMAMELQAKASKKVAVLVEDPKDPRRVEIVDDMNFGAFTWALFDHSLEAWEGISLEVEEGDPELTDEDVKRAIFDEPKLRQFVVRKARELLDATMDKLEKERKNSKSSQSG